MVNRKTPEFTTEFNGKVVNITIEKDKNEMSQYHLEILPLDLEIKGKTGYMHEWIRITKETTDTDIIEGSILDFYIQDLELCDKSVKNMKTHQEVLFFMKDKCFQFAKKKYGKSFNGKDAAEHWYPRKLLTESEIMDIEEKK
jgi:hypothetical protein